MATLENFRAFNFSEGLASVSITNNGVTFNKSVVLKLGCPEHVKLLFDDDGKQFAIQCCDEHAENAAPFFKKRDNGVISVRWNSRDLLNTFRDLMGWNLHMKGYKVDGILLREEKAMLFDLKEAKELS